MSTEPRPDPVSCRTAGMSTEPRPDPVSCRTAGASAPSTGVSPGRRASGEGVPVCARDLGDGLFTRCQYPSPTACIPDPARVPSDQPVSRRRYSSTVRAPRSRSATRFRAYSSAEPDLGRGLGLEGLRGSAPSSPRGRGRRRSRTSQPSRGPPHPAAGGHGRNDARAHVLLQHAHGDADVRAELAVSDPPFGDKPPDEPLVLHPQVPRGLLHAQVSPGTGTRPGPSGSAARRTRCSHRPGSSRTAPSPGAAAAPEARRWQGEAGSQVRRSGVGFGYSPDVGGVGHAGDLHRSVETGSWTRAAPALARRGPPVCIGSLRGTTAMRGKHAVDCADQHCCWWGHRHSVGGST